MKLNVIATFSTDQKWTKVVFIYLDKIFSNEVTKFRHNILVEIWRKALDHFVSVAKVVITPITQILYGLWTPNSKNILEKLYAPDFPTHWCYKSLASYYSLGGIPKGH